MTHFMRSFMNSKGIMKENSVSLSTVETEYMDIAICCAQLLLFNKYLLEFGIALYTIIFPYDNTSAFNIAKKHAQHKMTKHIDVSLHFQIDNIKKGTICIKFKTEDQVANIFIKSLNRGHF